MWENCDVSSKYQMIAGSLYLAFFIGWMVLCLYVMVLVKKIMVSIRFNLTFLDQCDEISPMFGDDLQLYKQWATEDLKYIDNA